MTANEAIVEVPMVATSAQPSEDADWGLMNRHLVFLDNDLESAFRAAERGRNLGQARFVLWLALSISTAFAITDIFVLPASDMTFITWRTPIMIAFLFGLLGLTYAPYFRTRWPILMTLAVYGITLSAGITNAFAGVPILYLSGYMLVILASYLVVPLLFTYCIGTVTTATAIFLAFTAFADVVDLTVFAELCVQMLAANVIGVAGLYRSERFRRLDHLNTHRLAEQRARYRELLTSILPAPIADRLERGETIIDECNDATVLFADLVGFTDMAVRHSPNKVLGLLNKLFARFDDLTAEHGLEKIKTIGDAYMVAGGVSDGNEAHLSAMADLALAMRKAAAELTDPDGRPVRMRIGIHAGGLTAGVIGRRRFMYDLWGDTVNTASRMESQGEPDRIQLSDAVRQRLDDSYRLAPRGEIAVKGKGQMATWYLLGRVEDDVMKREAV